MSIKIIGAVTYVPGLENMQTGDLAEFRNISVRHLKAVLLLSNEGNIARTADLLGRSRTAVSKAIAGIEKQIGAPLFDRSSVGYVPTKEGEILIATARTISQIFDDTAARYRHLHSRPRLVNAIPLFTMDIATKRLWQLSLLSDTESLEAAAKIAGQSKSTIYKSIHDLEAQLNMPLFARLEDGRLVPLQFGQYLCRQVKLVLSELQLALDDIRSAQGALEGRVTIGCLPSIRPYLLPLAIGKLLKKHPALSVRIKEAPYTQMAQELLRGEIDVIVGGTRSGLNDPDLVTEELANDRICITARPDHPLSQLNQITNTQLSEARWALPLSGLPARTIFDNCLREIGVVVRSNCIETGSTNTLSAIMQNDDLLTIGTIYQTYIERKSGVLVVLPVKLKDDSWPLGLTLRRTTKPSVSAKYFIDFFRDAVRESVLD